MADSILYSYAPESLSDLYRGHYVYGLSVHACVFLVDATVGINRIDLVLRKNDIEETVGTFTCEIQEVNQSTLNPTGVVLASKVLNLDDVTEKAWITFTLSSSATLVNGQYYAIVLHDTGYDNASYEYSILWWCRDGSPGLGILRYSDDGGSSWIDGAEWRWDDDSYGFRVWGSSFAPNNLITYPAARPDAYDPDAVWVPGLWTGGIGGTYTPPDWGGYEDGELVIAGGGRWNKQMVALGHGKVYFEALN